MSDEGLKSFNEFKRNQKDEKRNKNRSTFDKHGFKILKESNNIVTFLHRGETYFFTEVTNKIRKQGSKESISFTSFLKGNDISKENSKVFVEKESYKHMLAKNILFDWLKNENNNPSNIEGFSKLAQFEWRPNYGIFKELKFYTTSTSWYFETSGGLIGNITNEIDNANDVFEKSFNRGNILFVPDITIFHKGLPAIMIEIVYTNDLTKEKIKRIRDFCYREGFYPTIYTIKADDILEIQVGNIPNYIPCKEIKLWED